MREQQTMKKLMSFSLIGAASLFLVACSSDDSKNSGVSTVTELDSATDFESYRVTFISKWTSTNFPTNFPPNPHFSPPVVVTHSDQTQIWGPNVDVSNGVQQVAETGGTSIIRSEITAKGKSVIGETKIGTGPGNSSSSVTIKATEDFPLLSVITMVAPSPDWVVGVHDLSLRENADWIESKTIELEVYDVGTDSGARFTSGNQSESRRTAILLSSDRGDTDFEDGINFSTGDHIAELKIERIQDQ